MHDVDKVLYKFAQLGQIGLKLEEHVLVEYTVIRQPTTELININIRLVWEANFIIDFSLKGSLQMVLLIPKVHILKGRNICI